MSYRILVLNGPNLNLLGTREPEVYGKTTLDDIVAQCQKLGLELGCEIRHFQSNSEGELIDALHDAASSADGIVFNAGAFTHSSYALRDAISAIGLPVVETHISNVHARESFRHNSVLAPVCTGTIAGFGPDSYSLALRAMFSCLRLSSGN